MKAIVVTNHLYSIGGGAADAISIAMRLSYLMPTTLASTTIVSSQVRDIIPGRVKLERFVEGMQEGCDILFNVSHSFYAKPIAKRNIARIFCPTIDNKPPKEYELFSNSKFTSNIAHELWGVPCEVLYPFIENDYRSTGKRNIILNVARFVNPSRDADKGQLLLIEAFKALVNSGYNNWQLVLIGGLEAGQEGFLAQMNQAAKGYNIKILPNAEPETVKKMYGRAAIYWHAAGMGSKEIYSAQEHFGITTVEAMLAGCVPITHGTGGQPEIVEHAYDGFLVKSAQELYDITSGVISNPSSWSILSQRAQLSARRFLIGRNDIGSIVDKKPIELPEKNRWLMSSYSNENVSIIIPVHNMAAFTERCLESIKRTCPGVEVVLVDNASTDETQTKIKKMVEDNGWVYARRNENNGFAAAINYGNLFCTRKFVLLLNNDVEAIQDQWLSILLSEMRDESVGVVGPKLVFPDHTVQFAGGAVNKETGKGTHYHYHEPDSVSASERMSVEFITGACLLIRKELLNMDESYPLNGEDADMCIRIFSDGYSVIYQPGAVLIHYERMTKNNTPGSVEKEGVSEGVFIAKHYKSEV